MEGTFLLRKEPFKLFIVKMIKGFVEEIIKMIDALIEFDYEKALEEMEKNN